MSKIVEQLKRHEGFRSKPYLDTVGKSTVGYGRNLDDIGISKDEGEQLLINDLVVAQEELENNFVFYFGLSSVRRAVLQNMVFNMGISRLKGFKKTIAYIAAGHYELAADEMLDSKWARQVGSRAVELSDQMRSNEWQA